LSEPVLTLEVVGRKELVKDTLVVIEPETVAEAVVVSEYDRVRYAEDEALAAAEREAIVLEDMVRE
jgi:hypothetical protein